MMSSEEVELIMSTFESQNKCIISMIREMKQYDLRVKELEILVQDLYDKVHGGSQ